ncbi:hypothetical protein DYB28_001954 [Aphanomyces astaci]|uniref:Uncharacterized protein n=1 Tax=Aphanomyces astaci TaxID=112090 RepID=A0A397DRJ2_APHAT|nr:hypothetical protein DYB38_006979 [Aphanomyces astaci]RLO04586.1 hypothetical protein DYB28_001954 [Aphanomyces astaci]
MWIPPLFLLPGETVEKSMVFQSRVPGSIVSTSPKGFMDEYMFTISLEYFAGGHQTKVGPAGTASKEAEEQQQGKQLDYDGHDDGDDMDERRSEDGQLLGGATEDVQLRCVMGDEQCGSSAETEQLGCRAVESLLLLDTIVV